MMPGKAKWCAVWLLVLVVAGCEAKLRDTRTVEVDPAGQVVIPIDAKPSDRTLKVTARAEGGPIEVYVYLKKDDERANENIYAKKNELFLARKVNVQEADLSALVPANEEVLVVLMCANTKSATVHLTMED